MFVFVFNLVALYLFVSVVVRYFFSFSLLITLSFCRYLANFLNFILLSNNESVFLKPDI